MRQVVRAWFRVGRAFGVGREHAAAWQERWSDAGFRAPWMAGEVAPEILESVANGWFPAGGRVLDIGCGEGVTAAWLAERGFPSVGIDIAPAAVARARARFAEEPGRLEFSVVDVCRQPPPDRHYRILVDRGCFHGIPPHQHRALLDNLLGVSAPDARLLLLHRAFRKRGRGNGPAERAHATARVIACYGAAFRIMKSADTFLDPFGGQEPGAALPGVAFWMERSS